MKTLLSAVLLFLTILLFSCASIHKSGIPKESIPDEITQGKYKVLYTEINFENTVSKQTASVHNNAAKKYISKKTGESGLFIPESELKNEAYADINVYRYVVLNKITAKLIKTYYRQYGNAAGPKRYDGQSESYISEFYIVDRLTGKEYPHVKGTTMALYMLKAIVNKINQS